MFFSAYLISPFAPSRADRSVQPTNSTNPTAAFFNRSPRGRSAVAVRTLPAPPSSLAAIFNEADLPTSGFIGVAGILTVILNVSSNSSVKGLITYEEDRRSEDRAVADCTCQEEWNPYKLIQDDLIMTHLDQQEVVLCGAMHIHDATSSSMSNERRFHTTRG